MVCVLVHRAVCARQQRTKSRHSLMRWVRATHLARFAANYHIAYCIRTQHSLWRRLFMRCSRTEIADMNGIAMHVPQNMKMEWAKLELFAVLVAERYCNNALQRQKFPSIVGTAVVKPIAIPHHRCFRFKNLNSWQQARDRVIYFIFPRNL